MAFEAHGCGPGPKLWLHLTSEGSGPGLYFVSTEKNYIFRSVFAVIRYLSLMERHS